MIKLRTDISPSQDILKKLSEFQKEINSLNTFSEKSKKAKDLFPKKNTKSNKVFKEIKDCLTKLCNSTRRCVYCEDSFADEVEHIYPKDLYPQKCFDWNNYVYACGSCNGPKNNKFAIFKTSDGQFTEVNPQGNTTATEPPLGIAAMINPRNEDPLKFAMLDLSGTFTFYPRPNLTANERKKAEYTYYDVLRLNSEEREPLRQARENAYGMFKARLFQYVKEKNNNQAQAKLDKLKEGVLKENHPTVWKEMQRYYKENLLASVDQELKELFDNAPEALKW
jgi:uncharacterized protein (TIGR02646 family)